MQRKIISCLILVTFVFDLIAQHGVFAASGNLPPVGQMVSVSANFTPVVLKGIKLDADDPFRLTFLLDGGDTKFDNTRLKDEVDILVRYFMAALTTPEQDLWVNLSPNESKRIIPQSLGLTDLGRDLLAQDYILKQLSASLTYPTTETGKQYWSNSINSKNSLTKVWITPDKTRILEAGYDAYIKESTMKVKSEDNSPAMQSLLSVIEQDVNHGKNFAYLRQIHNAIVLAAWFKKRLKDSIYGQLYIDKNKTAGIDTNDKDAVNKVYAQYIEAFKQGVYNYTQNDRVANRIIKRAYFCGGYDGKVTAGMRTESGTATAITNVQAASQQPISATVQVGAAVPAVSKDFLNKNPKGMASRRLLGAAIIGGGMALGGVGYLAHDKHELSYGELCQLVNKKIKDGSYSDAIAEAEKIKEMGNRARVLTDIAIAQIEAGRSQDAVATTRLMVKPESVNDKYVIDPHPMYGSAYRIVESLLDVVGFQIRANAAKADMQIPLRLAFDMAGRINDQGGFCGHRNSMMIRIAGMQKLVGLDDDAISSVKKIDRQWRKSVVFMGDVALPVQFAEALLEAGFLDEALMAFDFHVFHFDYGWTRVAGLIAERYAVIDQGVADIVKVNARWETKSSILKRIALTKARNGLFKEAIEIAAIIHSEGVTRDLDKALEMNDMLHNRDDTSDLVERIKAMKEDKGVSWTAMNSVWRNSLANIFSSFGIDLTLEQYEKLWDVHLAGKGWEIAPAMFRAGEIIHERLVYDADRRQIGYEDVEVVEGSDGVRRVRNDAREVIEWKKDQAYAALGVTRATATKAQHDAIALALRDGKLGNEEDTLDGNAVDELLRLIDEYLAIKVPKYESRIEGGDPMFDGTALQGKGGTVEDNRDDIDLARARKKALEKKIHTLAKRVNGSKDGGQKALEALERYYASRGFFYRHKGLIASLVLTALLGGSMYLMTENIDIKRQALAYMDRGQWDKAIDTAKTIPDGQGKMAILTAMIIEAVNAGKIEEAKRAFMAAHEADEWMTIRLVSDSYRYGYFNIKNWMEFEAFFMQYKRDSVADQLDPIVQAKKDWQKYLKSYMAKKHPEVVLTSALVDAFWNVHTMSGGWRLVDVKGYEMVPDANGSKEIDLSNGQKVKVRLVPGSTIKAGDTIAVDVDESLYRLSTVHVMHTGELGATFSTTAESAAKKADAIRRGIPAKLVNELMFVGLLGGGEDPNTRLNGALEDAYFRRARNAPDGTFAKPFALMVAAAAAITLGATGIQNNILSKTNAQDTLRNPPQAMNHMFSTGHELGEKWVIPALEEIIKNDPILVLETGYDKSEHEKGWRSLLTDEDVGRYEYDARRAIEDKAKTEPIYIINNVGRWKKYFNDLGLLTIAQASLAAEDKNYPLMRSDWQNSLKDYLGKKYPDMKLSDADIEKLWRVHLMPGGWLEITDNKNMLVPADGADQEVTLTNGKKIKVKTVSGRTIKVGDTVVVFVGSGHYRLSTLRIMHNGKRGATLSLSEENAAKRAKGISEGFQAEFVDELMLVGFLGGNDGDPENGEVGGVDEREGLKDMQIEGKGAAIKLFGTIPESMRNAAGLSFKVLEIVR